MDVSTHAACSLERGPCGRQHAWSLQFREGHTWMSTCMEPAVRRGAHMDVNMHGALSSEGWMEDFSFLVAAAFAPQTGQVQRMDFGWREQLCTFSVNLTLLCKVLISKHNGHIVEL